MNFNGFELFDKGIYVANLDMDDGIAVYRFRDADTSPTAYYSRIHFRTYCGNQPYVLNTCGTICGRNGVLSIRKANENEKELLKHYEKRRNVSYG
jgi:hypothetical protein